MAIKTEQELQDKIKELQKDEAKFEEFLRDTYGDKQCEHKIKQHTWRIRREIEILHWVLNNNKELPF